MTALPSTLAHAPPVYTSSPHAAVFLFLFFWGGGRRAAFLIKWMGGGRGAADVGMKGPEAVIGIFLSTPPTSVLSITWRNVFFPKREKRHKSSSKAIIQLLLRSSFCYCAPLFEMKCQNCASNIIEVKCCLSFFPSLL